MNVLEIVKELSKNIGIDEPSVAVGSTVQEVIEAVHFTEMTCEELTRRFDWPSLEKTFDFAGVGLATVYNFPADMMRLAQGNAVAIAGTPLRGSLSPDEWLTLSPVSGTPRFFYVKDRTIQFWPYPAIGVTVATLYQSKNWNTTLAKWTKDTQTALVPDHLILKGALWRWRRHKGQPHEDHMAEYEAALDDYSQFSREDRTP